MLETLHASVVQASPAVPTGGGSHFDLTTMLASLGCTIPMFVWLLKMHRDLVQVVIPRGFRLIRREMRRQGSESNKRHAEHIAFMRELTKAHVRGKPSKKAKPKPQPHHPPPHPPVVSAARPRRRKKKKS